MVKKFHASMPRHKPSTMRFLAKSFGVKPRSIGAVKSMSTKKSGIRRGRRS